LGEDLITQGARGSELFIVESGEVEVARRNNPDEDEKVLTRLYKVRGK
jgi:CRP-like cAMP-binding protein